jgi:hypothetical protein
MVLDTSDGLAPAEQEDGLRIQLLEPDAAVLHAKMVARGFEMVEEPPLSC